MTFYYVLQIFYQEAGQFGVVNYTMRSVVYPEVSTGCVHSRVLNVNCVCEWIGSRFLLWQSSLFANH